MIKVILVDDSPVVLGVLKKMLAESDEIEVVATAPDGKQALFEIERTRPDVILTDLEMPEMNGLELTRAVMETNPLPIMVVSAQVRDRQSQQVFELLRAGAIEIFPKPEDGMSPANAGLRKELIHKIRILSGIVVFHRHASESRPASTARDTGAVNPGSSGILVCGSSTGGPQALLKFLGALDQGFPLPVVCVQHISAGFLGGLVDWLGDYCDLPVSVAEEGGNPRPGHIYFPEEGRHLTMDAGGSFRYQAGDLVNGHCPSVDVLFESVAGVHGDRAIGVILTGMGADGARGLLALKNKGAATIAQDEASSTVFGMPARAIELGAADQVLPLAQIAGAVARLAKDRS